MPELKPCPFCGQTPKMEESARFPRYGKDEGKRIKGYTVVCQNMYCILHNEDNRYPRSENEAAEAWNHRAEPDETCKQLCESFGASANATVRELFDAIEQLNSSAEPKAKARPIWKPVRRPKRDCVQATGAVHRAPPTT